MVLPPRRFDRLFRSTPAQAQRLHHIRIIQHVLKLSPTSRRLWAEILTRLPDSRIVFAGVPQGPIRDGLIRDFEKAGIAAGRIATFPRVGSADYFRSFNDVDVALDTTPYSGGTTTCDALWMGVPVITVPGTRRYRGAPQASLRRSA